MLFTAVADVVSAVVAALAAVVVCFALVSPALDVAGVLEVASVRVVIVVNVSCCCSV